MRVKKRRDDIFYENDWNIDYILSGIEIRVDVCCALVIVCYG